MSGAVLKNHETFVLPASVVTKLDVSRLVSEVEKIDNELTANAVRSKTKVAAQAVSVFSQQLLDFLDQNSLKLEDAHARADVIKEVRKLKDAAPVIHMTFAVEADNESLQQLVQWVRSSVHPQALLHVGLQPSLVAGVYMRTPNHVHDFSLRAVLAGKRQSLVKELETLRVSR